MRLKSIFIFLIVLLIFASAASLLFRRIQGPSRISIDISRVEKIQLGRVGPTETPEAQTLVTLVKAKGPDRIEWRIPDLSNAQADPKKVDQFLNEIVNLSQGGKIQAKDKVIFRIALFDAQWSPLAMLLVGSARDPEGRLYVYRENSKGTYLANPNLMSAMGILGDPTAEQPRADYWIANSAPRGTRLSNEKSV